MFFRYGASDRVDQIMNFEDSEIDRAGKGEGKGRG